MSRYMYRKSWRTLQYSSKSNSFPKVALPRAEIEIAAMTCCKVCKSSQQSRFRLVLLTCSPTSDHKWYSHDKEIGFPPASSTNQGRGTHILTAARASGFPKVVWIQHDQKNHLWRGFLALAQMLETHWNHWNVGGCHHWLRISALIDLFAMIPHVFFLLKMCISLVGAEVRFFISTSLFSSPSPPRHLCWYHVFVGYIISNSKLSWLDHHYFWSTQHRRLPW